MARALGFVTSNSDYDSSVRVTNFDEDITKIDSLDLVAFDSNIKGEAEIINLFSGFPKSKF